MFEAWDHPREEHWYWKGVEVLPFVREISDRTILERNEPPPPAMTASVTWSVKVRAFIAKEKYENFILCYTVSGI
jgi:hypothetical protein